MNKRGGALRVEKTSGETVWRGTDRSKMEEIDKHGKEREEEKGRENSLNQHCVT